MSNLSKAKPRERKRLIRGIDKSIKAKMREFYATTYKAQELEKNVPRVPPIRLRLEEE